MCQRPELAMTLHNLIHNLQFYGPHNVVLRGLNIGGKPHEALGSAAAKSDSDNRLIDVTGQQETALSSHTVRFLIHFVTAILADHFTAITPYVDGPAAGLKRLFQHRLFLIHPKGSFVKLRRASDSTTSRISVGLSS